MNITHCCVYVHVTHHLFHCAYRCAAIYRSRAKGMTARAMKVDIGYPSITQRLPPSSFDGRDGFTCLWIFKQVARTTSLITQALQYRLEVWMNRNAAGPSRFCLCEFDGITQEVNLAPVQRQYLSPPHPCVSADDEDVTYMSAGTRENGHKFFFVLIRQVACHLIVFTKKLNPFTWVGLKFAALNRQVEDAREQLNLTVNRSRSATLATFDGCG